MKILKVLALIAVLPFAATAWAAPTPVGFDLGTLGDGDSAGFVNQGIVPGVFIDTWTFDLAVASDVSVSFSSLELEVLNWSISGLGGTVDAGADLGTEFTLFGLAAGAHTLDISGTVQIGDTGFYSGGMGARAVPLPAAFWLFASAICSLTVVARSRNPRVSA